MCDQRLGVDVGTLAEQNEANDSEKEGKDEAGHLVIHAVALKLLRHSGMVRQHQTRNLEIPGSTLRIAPE
ncbi:hypothetical protein ACFIOY_03595 [Bradyrhizobium sp. TZ2]